MYEIRNGTVCVPAKILYDGLNLITETYYKQLCYKGTLNKVQIGGNGRQALVELKSIPAGYRQKIIKEYGEPLEEPVISRVEYFYQEDMKARAVFEEHILPDGRHLSLEHQEEYTANASMLTAIDAVVNETLITRKSRGGSKAVNWIGIADTVKRLKDIKDELGNYFYKHTLPENERRLRDKYNDYMKNGYTSLISGKFMNKNTAKIDNEVKIAVLQELLGDGRNIDNKLISDLYNTIAKVKGWKEIDASTVSNWRKKLKRVTEAGRRGSKHYKNTLSMQVKRSRPSAPLFYWTADGWKAELFYQKQTISKNGKTTTYHHRLTIVVILDAFNNYPIGYAIGENESPELITEALRNAVNHTKELFGERYRTWQLQTDNYQKKNLTPIYQAIADKWTPAEVGNAKSKVIEPYFKDLNKICQLNKNWAGHNITASRDKQVNDEWLNMNKKYFPDATGCKQQIIQIIEMQRAKKREEFITAFNSLPAADKLNLSNELYLYKFGHKTEPNRLEGQGLTPRIGGIEHFYDCYDLNFRNHYAERWVIHYDPDDTKQALAVAKDKEQLRFMVEEKYIQPMALRDLRYGDSTERQKITDYNKKDREYITEKRTRGAEMVQELLLSDKELENGVLAGLLITDSRGQHKDRRFQLPASEEVEYEESVTGQKESDYLKSKVNLNEYL